VPPLLRFAKQSGGGNTRTAMLFDPFLLEQKRRVQQPPKMFETFGGPKGKIDPERENGCHFPYGQFN